MAEILGIPINDVFRRAKYLGINKRVSRTAWVSTTSDENYLRNNFMILTKSEMANNFGVSIGTITRKLRMLGLRKFQQSIWRNKDNEVILIENFAAQTTKELSVFFGVPEITIRQKAKRLNLKKPECIYENRAYYFCPECKFLVWGKPGLTVVCGKCNKACQENKRSRS